MANARNIGGPLPEPCRTGGFVWSSGLIRPNFGQIEDAGAGLDAPEMLARGSTGRYEWECGYGEFWFPVQSVMRDGVWP